MLDDQAALGVVGLILVTVMVVVGLMRFNYIFATVSTAVTRVVTRVMRTRAAVISLVFLMLGLLIYGIASFGLVNSLPSEEQHVERNRETNRMIMSQDKDGCLDMRTLGRSNGVYLSLNKCKPADKKDQDK
jgi:hypothetical protein